MSMDLLLIPSPFSFLACVLFVFMVLKMAKRFTETKSLNLPPGPWKLPIIGNMHQFIGCDLPHHRLRELSKKYGPIMHLKIGEIQAFVVESTDFTREIFHTHDLNFSFRAETVAAQIMTYDYSWVAFTPQYGEHWKQLRRITMNELLSKKRVQSYRPAREEVMNKVIKSIASRAGSEVSISDLVVSMSASFASKMVLGEKCSDREEFIEIAKEFMIAAAGGSIADLFPSYKSLRSVSGVVSRMKKLQKRSDRIVSNILQEHKATKSDDANEDVIDVLLRLQQEGDLKFPITDNTIKAAILELFIGSFDTSAQVLEWAISELMRNPKVLKKAQDEVREVFNRKGNIDESGVDEMQFLKLVIKETFRLHPPGVLLFTRVAKDKCRINGFDIPAKTQMIINIWAMGRDPELWTQPESFIPERFIGSSADYIGNDVKYLPFGAGRRICPGISFANANMELPLAMLLYHFDWELPNQMKPQDLDMSEVFGMTTRRKHELFLIPTIYDHPSSTEGN